MKIEFIGKGHHQNIEKIDKHLKNAIRILNVFLRANDFEIKPLEYFINSVKVYFNHDDLKRVMSKAFDVEEAEIQDTYVAMIDNKIMHMMVEDYYMMHYPDAIETDAYAKLIAHELAHQYHIYLLGGDEDKMGPIWFYEGFAIVAADQFINTDFILDKEMIKNLMFSSERGSYKLYGMLLRLILKHQDLKQLVNDAHKENFSKDIYALLSDL